MSIKLLTWLLDSAIRSLVAASVVGAILLAFRVRVSSVRHAAWTAVLGAMLAMPILPYCLPSVSMPTSVPFSLATLQAGLRNEVQTVEVKIGASSQGSVADSSASPANLQTPSEFTVTLARPVASANARFDWSPLLLGVYVIGVFILAFRLIVGWRASSRLTRASAPIDLAADRASLWARLTAHRAIQLHESTIVATPVTVGVTHPSVILPASWRDWSDDTLRAVLAHELAHIRRRDPLILFLARLNCAFFWCNPLAWWLKATLATTAEHASDDEALREVGEDRRYAEVLLDMAQAVRVRGSRLAWQGVGIDGSGLLGQRIDRIMRGDRNVTLSRLRKLGLAASCATALFIAAACQQSKPVEPLRPDSELAKTIAEQNAGRARYEKAIAMTADDVNQLEASLKTNPDNLEALETLHSFYLRSGQKVFGWNEMIARRRPHLLYVIEHHPEHELAGNWQIGPTGDPEGYVAARKAWLMQTGKPDTSVNVLKNASLFFRDPEPRLAERFLLRAKALEPQDTAWSSRLGSLYGQVINGPRSPQNGAPLTGFDTDPYAKEIKAKLLASNDVKLIAAAGIDIHFRNTFDDQRKAFGKLLLERVLEIDPQSSNAAEIRRRLKASTNELSSFFSTRDAVWQRAAELAGPAIAEKVKSGARLTHDENQAVSMHQYEAVASLPESERLPKLVDLAEGAYLAAENRGYYDSDEAGAKQLREQSTKAADAALALARRFKDSPDYGWLYYRVNIARAINAQRDGDRKAALRYMSDAAKAPTSERLTDAAFMALDDRLTDSMLNAGERESVALFMEASAKLRPGEGDRLLREAAAVRSGTMPQGYQFRVTRVQ